MIDLHCHILPGIDDGPGTMEEAVAMARAIVAAGTTTVVATPHVSGHYSQTTAVSVAAAVAALGERLTDERIPLEVRTGAEIAMSRAVELDDEELVALRLGGPGGTHLLVESPLSPSASGFDEVLALLHSRGHAVLLAHPERCPAFRRDPGAYERLVAQGALGQVTAGALVGRFGRAVQELADRMVREGLAQVVASDAHSVVRRPPSMRRELIEAGYRDQAAWLTTAVPGAVLAGTPLPAPPPMPRQRSRLARLRAG